MRRQRNLKSKPEFVKSAPLFAALGDEVRLRLVHRLCSGGPASITSLTGGSGLTRQAITKHLRVMESSGLVRCTWRGRESVWYLDENRIEDARRYIEIISQQWDVALGKLREFVER